ncbi:hypothetical protein B0H10DRAFT_262581 [Mycena sp. CBHHK59/15]|nr:hypothetical protein B0H10DRAFT_262581 [Mycena sp. CBHHK59/15]
MCTTRTVDVSFLLFLASECKNAFRAWCFEISYIDSGISYRRICMYALECDVQLFAIEMKQGLLLITHVHNT